MHILISEDEHGNVIPEDEDIGSILSIAPGCIQLEVGFSNVQQKQKLMKYCKSGKLADILKKTIDSRVMRKRFKVKEVKFDLKMPGTFISV